MSIPLSDNPLRAAIRPYVLGGNSTIMPVDISFLSPGCTTASWLALKSKPALYSVPLVGITAPNPILTLSCLSENIYNF